MPGPQARAAIHRAEPHGFLDVNGKALQDLRDR
jgi:hypothetical protein